MFLILVSKIDDEHSWALLFKRSFWKTLRPPFQTWKSFQTSSKLTFQSPRPWLRTYQHWSGSLTRRVASPRKAAIALFRHSFLSRCARARENYIHWGEAYTFLLYQHLIQMVLCQPFCLSFCQKERRARGNLWRVRHANQKVRIFLRVSVINTEIMRTFGA